MALQQIDDVRDSTFKDKVITYRWFVVALRLVILAHAAAAVFALVWFFTTLGLIWATVVALAILALGWRLIMGGSAQPS